ncbi:MAG: two-component system nitrogen regulation sensor histidine kinase GlnL [Paracoccaceae bacterium]|jgi:two-component system nitrogen regulation sensor histidine kinase GlnL
MTHLTDSIWSALPTPAVLVDAQDRIIDINPAGEAFLNATARVLKQLPIWDRLMIDAPLEESFARVRDAQSPLVLNDVYVGTGDRPPVRCTVQIAPVMEDGQTLIFLITPRDLAERIGRSQSAETAAKSAIGMAEMLAHEIKNPLAGITGAAQLLSMGLSGEDRELTDLIVAESRRIVKLLDQVEQFGNLRPPLCKALNIHDLLDRAKKSAMVGYGAHMQFEEEFDPSLPPTFVDGDQILQVFLNLLKNASEASSGSAGTIRLHTFYDPALRVRRKDGSWAQVPIQVEIIDNGPGLPSEIAGDIFEPFVSGRENGTGLGLALVSKIVTDHHGWISVDSVPGKTVFRISLPVATDTTHFDNFEEAS